MVSTGEVFCFKQDKSVRDCRTQSVLFCIGRKLLLCNTQGMPEKEEYYYRMAEQNKVDEQRKIKGEEIETLTILPVEFAEGGTIR